MTKGTPSMGKKSGKKTHLRCHRCGERSYHIRKKRCSSCGYGKSSKLRKYKWNKRNTSKKK
ncbi:MAG: 50S ribosomal protein L37e [Nanoarchaeota archaeon]|nr:50S ribosomal protein L37e [Nanoarchaeota archaeon]